MIEPPTGTVTFLFTDIEGSTKRWEKSPGAMSEAVARHDRLLSEAIAAHGGYVFKTVGDAFCSAFDDHLDALKAALAAQRAVQAEDWSAVGGLRVRMALHTGEAEVRNNDYFGQPVNRVARLLSAGHGAQTLLSQATFSRVRDDLPAGVTLRDYGERRLKDLARPERIFGLLALDLPADFPPLKTLDARPNNLPTQATAFIGRERELQSASSLLRREDVHWVTMTGPGGTGKTRLALQTAASLADEFEDGVYFVPLATLTDPALVVPTISGALGVRESPGLPLLESLKAHLRGKQMLLLLDNFEQVSAAAPSIAELLEATSGLKILITSRRVLRIYGEHSFQVPPMRLPGPRRRASLEHITGNESVRLFAERAAAVKSGFHVNDRNAQAVADICRLLDGLPLAIELAAARAHLFSPSTMLERLESRLKLLTAGPRNVPARQQTLRNTIAWSYELLDPTEAAMFAHLGVFVGGCRPSSAVVVCADPQTEPIECSKLNIQGSPRAMLAALASLTDNSLLRLEQPDAEGEPAERYVMLETVREYALERLAESGEAPALRERHARYFLALAEEAEPELIGAAQAVWLARLDEEHDNLRAALRMAHESNRPEDALLGLRLAGALTRFWSVRGYATEGRSQLATALSHATEALPTPSSASDPSTQSSVVSPQSSLRAKALTAAANLAWTQGDYEASTASQREALAIYRQLGDEPGVAQALNNLGNVALDLGNFTEAQPLYEESLQIYRELNDKRGIAMALSNLGLVAYALREYDLASSLHAESLALRRDLGNKGGIANSLNNLGAVAYDLGNYAEAQPLYEESLQIYRELDSKRGIAVVLNNLGNVAHDFGNYARARALHEESLELMRDLEDKWGLAETLEGLARALSSAEVQGYERERGTVMGYGIGSLPTIPSPTQSSVLSSQSSLERAGLLWGAAEALRESAGTPLSAADRARHDRTVSEARALLDPPTFDAAWQQGRETPMDQVIDQVLHEPEPVREIRKT
ncbi:MAG: tetratricopeptide repeat protein [Chloroflexia bacterium]